MANLSNELVQYRGLFLFILVLGIGGTFQYGFNISVMNAPSPFMKAFINQTWIRRYATPIPPETLTLIWSFVVSVFSIGGLIGSTASGYFIGKFGKKKCQLYNCLLPLASALLVGLSRTVNSIEMIVVGRFLCGFYSGLGINVHAQFAGDIAPRKLRGFINATGPLFVTLGKLFGQIVGLREFFGTESLWPQLLLTSAIISFVQLVTLPFFPESPTYLLLDKGDKEGCMRALKQLWGDRDHQPHIDQMMKDHGSSKRKMSALELLKDQSHRCQLCVMIGMILCLQLSGANAIYFYSYDVFQAAGFPQDQIAYVSLGVGAFEFISALICSLLIDRFGRRVLILGGYSLMTLTLGILTVTLSLQDAYIWMPYCSVASTFLFIFLYGAGPAHTSGLKSLLYIRKFFTRSSKVSAFFWANEFAFRNTLYNTHNPSGMNGGCGAGATISTCVEIFSQVPRVPAFVISGCFSWVGLYILGMVFPYIVGTLNHFCFLLFMGVIVISATLIFFIVPETKGKTIAQISDEFNKFNFRRQHKQNKVEAQDCIISTRL